MSSAPTAPAGKGPGRLPARPRVAIFGMFGADNLGNEGSLDAFLRFLRDVRPEATVECIAWDPAKVTREHGIAAIPMQRSFGPIPAKRPPLVIRALRRLFYHLPAEVATWFRALGRLRGFDVLVIPGTGILDDFGGTPNGMPYELLKNCLAARLAGTPVILLSVGAGPIRHRLSRFYLKTAARLASYRSYRDTESREFMQSIGFPASSDPVYPDIVFSLPPASAVASAPGATPRVVGLGLMTYYGWSNQNHAGEAIYRKYLADITDFLVWLLEQDYEVRLLIGKATDQKAVEDVCAAAGRQCPDRVRRQLHHEPIRRIHDVFAQAAATDLVIATRFHNVVSALVQARPVLSLGYSSKNEAIMQTMGLADFCQHVEQIDRERLRRQFTELAAGWQEHRARIHTTTESFHQQSLDQLARVFGTPVGRARLAAAARPLPCPAH